MIRDPRSPCKEQSARKGPFFQGFDPLDLPIATTGPASDMLAKKRRMGDFQQQLVELRQRVARINQKYTRADDPAPLPPARFHVEEFVSGEEVETTHGRHFEPEKLYERHRRHG